ncbi:hypothetical protein RvY_18239 [Ramazzottius varieornatus]|uniref:Uncharacterized protein n=1 Tax=Ramazzottius varieornatus TaxID=947166 RepID=A0A1D1W6R2_RAMVA|nr:hypothetical protein RvY_18239 [Ramazzottius varieornatus]
MSALTLKNRALRPIAGHFSSLNRPGPIKNALNAGNKTLIHKVFEAFALWEASAAVAPN